jgi:dTDP-4-dehydrorhamnose 3,5-epimerase
VKGTLRGLHFQNPKPQGKLATVLRGSVLDVAVDVRIASPTFGQHVIVELNDENRRQAWIPGGLAHGFIVTSDTADFLYKCDEFYSPAHEFVLRWNDPALHINWGCDTPLVSARDGDGRCLADLTDALPRFEPSECVF